MLFSKVIVSVQKDPCFGEANGDPLGEVNNCEPKIASGEDGTPTHSG